jgi:hypothetical protein
MKELNRDSQESIGGKHSQLQEGRDKSVDNKKKTHPPDQLVEEQEAADHSVEQRSI